MAALGRPSGARLLLAATMTLDWLQLVKPQPHFICSLKSQLFIQMQAFIAGVQIDGAQPLLLDPRHNCQHDLPSNSTFPDLRLGVHIQDYRPLSAWVFRIRRPRTEQHATAARAAARGVQRQPMVIGAIGQSPCQPRTRNFHHPIKFRDRAFSHIAKHRPPVMKNDRRLARCCLSNRNVRWRHVRTVNPGLPKGTIKTDAGHSRG